MKTDARKKQTSTSKLEREVTLLRSYVIGTVGQDREGEYRPAFVARTLQSLHSAFFEFKSARDFLSRIR